MQERTNEAVDTVQDESCVQGTLDYGTGVAIPLIYTEIRSHLTSLARRLSVDLQIVLCRKILAGRASPISTDTYFFTLI